ncbi:Hint domain-containing protein [Alterinioella nitratireducens]|uniref:Hint domain-containing protein n=1 Tax=Alterinioella nitratireducens TaxID=2735915 RepID=UPI000C45C720|nr:hypothetical protein [Nioella sp.]
MGYNIADVSGNATGGPNDWGLTLDLSDPSATTISGDFDVVSLTSGNSQGEATGGYSFSALNTTAWGTLSFNTVTGEYTFTVDRSAVIQSGSDQVVSFTIVGTSGGNSDDDTVTINILICVARGTMIDTPEGPVAVETLATGDLVRTLDGPPQRVRWIGSRRLDRAALAADPSLRPVRIAQDAFGPARPARDLVVSPQHRIYLDDWRADLLFGEAQVLAPAKGLVNDHSIRVDTQAEEVEYFHLLFDNHEVIYTENTPTESFHPGDYTLCGLEDDVREELFALFPTLQSDADRPPVTRPALKVWEAAMLADAS